MILDPSTLGVFVVASVLLILAPGPDVIFLVSQSVAQGPRAGFLTALGLASGNLVHTFLAALGISVVFRASPVAFQGLKIAGVVYLLYLAWKAVRAAPKPEEPAQASEALRPGASLFLRGVLMNVLNPKVALFFLAFLPQFVTPAAGPVWVQMVLYGVIFTVLVVVIFGAIGLSAGHVARRMGARWAGRGAAGWGRWLVAGVYAALAARLALVHA